MIKGKTPLWHQRRWRLLNKAFNTTEFQQLLKDVENEIVSSVEAAQILFSLMPKIKLPGDCYFIALVVLQDPKSVHDEEFVKSLIVPPINWVSFRNRMRGPSEPLKSSFEEWENTRTELLKKGYDPLTSDNAILIEVKPTTTKQELIDFIEQYYDNELKPQLKIQARDRYYYPTDMEIGRRISEESINQKRDTKIIDLHRLGKTPKEIAEELRYNIEPSNVRTILSRLRKDGKL